MPQAPACACALGRAPTSTPGNPAPLTQYRDRGIRVGWDAQWGQGQCFQRGRETRHRNIPHSRKFPFRGHRVCAGMALGARGGGVGGGQSHNRTPPGRVRREGQAGGEVPAGSLAAPSSPKAATRAFHSTLRGPRPGRTAPHLKAR